MTACVQGYRCESLAYNLPHNHLMSYSRDPAFRRRLAYPILTLTVVGGIYLYSRGQIGLTPLASADAYIAAARLVVSEARAGSGISNAAGTAIDLVYAANAPSSLKSTDGGVPTFEVKGATLPEGERPWIQDVIVRMPDGGGITLSISIKDGVTEVIGVGRAETSPPGSIAPTATTEGTAP